MPLLGGIQLFFISLVVQTFCLCLDLVGQLFFIHRHLLPVLLDKRILLLLDSLFILLLLVINSL